jgi:hemerythrin-like domain-containing protein
MDLYQLLRQDHQKLMRLLERLDETVDATTNSRDRLFATLKQALELHARLEETHFYPALQRRDAARLLVEDALAEHEEMAELLAGLEATDREEEDWADMLEALRETVEAHLEVEEGELFAQAQALLDPEEAQAIARKIAEEAQAAKPQ